MVISKAPLRISIAGGGTDLPVWYRDHGSIFISAAIDKYIYTTAHRSPFDKRIRVRYSTMEQVDSVDEVKNEIARETLKICDITDSIEITSHAEIPSGTGLGSSGTFGVGMLHALNPEMDPTTLAVVSSHIQMNKLKLPVGFQDQCVAAVGGVAVYTIESNGHIRVLPIKGGLKDLEENLLMFYTGIKRDTNKVLEGSSTDGLDKIQELAFKTLEAFGKQNWAEYGKILNEHWEYKKKRGRMTSPEIDKWYKIGLKNGAIGGKIIGAGGGGFLLFYTEDKLRLIKNMPLMHVPFKFSKEGSKILLDE
jgi:D-glycero-alpha-D-manno-heptose-7-phosphate kinase